MKHLVHRLVDVLGKLVRLLVGIHSMEDVTCRLAQRWTTAGKFVYRLNSIEVQRNSDQL